MRTTILSIACSVVLMTLAVAIVFHFREVPSAPYEFYSTTTVPFVYSFNTPGVLYEKGKESESTSPYWWLNSGAMLIIENNVGSTNQGRLSAINKWRLAYARSSATDTGEGFYPQNLFRLITRTRWQNFREQAYFKITSTNMMDSENRNESNGLLLLSRYVDGNNFYYLGLRVDGTAVIKKKQNGIYYTLAQTKIYPGAYDKYNNPNLLPANSWIGIASRVEDVHGGVLLTLLLDLDQSGDWKQVLGVKDEKIPIKTSAFGGIRTDFMDVYFKDFVIITI